MTHSNAQPIVTYKNVAKQSRVPRAQIEQLDLGADKYYLAVGYAPSIGGWSCQVFEDKEEPSINIARMTAMNGNSSIDYYWYVNEDFFDAIDSAFDRGVEGDEDYAGTDVRGMQCALDSFEILIERCD